jgi:hypothetical protein
VYADICHQIISHRLDTQKQKKKKKRKKKEKKKTVHMGILQVPHGTIVLVLGIRQSRNDSALMLPKK